MSSTDTLGLAVALIRRASVTPDDRQCQHIVADQLEPTGFSVEHMPFGDVDNIWASHGSGSPLLVFLGHTDVVPTGPEDQWTHPPFSAEMDRHWLHGRGAADMKSSVAAMTVAARKFVEQFPDHAGTLALLFTSDEEGPAVNGTVKVIEELTKRDISIDYCVVGEPTCESEFGDVIKVGRRGSLNAVMHIHGIQGHVAYPEKVDNPVHAAGAFIDELSNTHWDNGNEFFPPTSLQITNIEAGTGATNVVPGELTLRFNLRFCPESDADSLINKIEEIAGRTLERFEFHWRIDGMPFQAPEGKLLDAVASAVKNATGLTPRPSTAGGTSDGRFVAPTGAEVVEFGPINENIHKINERVGIYELEPLTDIYQSIAERLLTAKQQ